MPTDLPFIDNATFRKQQGKKIVKERKTVGTL